MPKKTFLKTILFTAITIFAAGQEQATPYDLIRPTWPLTWDESMFDNFDTTVTRKKNMVPKNRTPAAYKANDYIPDTLNQAYLDNINAHMSPIRLNQAGYLEKDTERQFYYVGTATNFEIVDVEGKSFSPAITGTMVSSGQTTSSDWSIIAGTNAATNDQKRYRVDITGQSGTIMVGNIPQGLPTDTRMRIKVGNDISSTFIISDKVYSMVRNAALKFYGINRSGHGESWFHPASHTKDGAGGIVVNPDASDGARGVYNASMAGTLEGGYYDCGDHLKESLTQMYAFMVAAVMAATNPDADEDVYAYNQGETVNTDGIPDMLREAKHGADFVLKSFVRAEGVIDDMALSVGTFGTDHGWWGRPENQDDLPVDNSASATDRGGPASRAVRLGEVGSTVGGETAAGLAILGKLYAQYDKPFADSCLMVAKKMYDFAKNLMLKKGSYDGGKSFKNHKTFKFDSEAYNGNNEAYDDLALAAVALHFATYEESGDMSYFNDAVQNTEFSSPQEQEGNGFFDGGWMAFTRDGMRKSMKNTSWANAYTYTLYSLYKLLLKDDATALKYGISTETTKSNSPRTRLWYAENVALLLGTNLASESFYNGSKTVQIDIPNLNNTPLNVDGIWYTMQTDQTWIYNRYQMGNIFEVLTYSDVTKDLEGVTLPQKGQSRDWHSAEMRQLGINQLNYMLGVNPWDVSFILGIGDKNDAHPHHRAANPEGKNVAGANYKYNPPTGALFGGVAPGLTNSWVPDNKSWEDYHLSETCIDAAATLVGVTMLAAQEVDKTAAPDINVEIRHVSMDSAIIVVKLTQRGTVDLIYGTDESAFSNTANSANAGVYHEIILRNLTPGTLYNFYVKGYNAYNPANTNEKYMIDSTKTPFSFTTLNMVDAADIQNITVCNIEGDSAEIMWYTPNGEYESKIYWDVSPHTEASEYAYNSGAGNADVSGIPTKFHYVKIGGLKEKTTYYFMVESNGMQVNVNRETGTPLKFTTSVMQYDFSVRTYQYEWDGKPAINLNIFNNESRAFDSLTIRMYMRGDDDLYDDVAIRTDICQAYDEAGFNKACDASTLAQLNEGFRHARPVKIEDTYDAESKTWQWYFPIPLGSTVIKSSSRFRVDVLFVARIRAPGQDDPLDIPPENKKFYCRSGDSWHWVTDITSQEKLSANPGDWSWMPHSTADAEDIDYAGLPCEEKDAGDVDLDVAPINPYVSVYRKDQFVWGYSPSQKEMETKRADYKMEVTLDPPFDVSNESYIAIDQTSSTVYATGHASISDGGYITKVWANGQLVTGAATIFGNEKIIFNADGTDIVAQYNIATGLWDLKIPVKMAVGSNKIDITIFAGPNPTCDACIENGGCAFENRTYYVQFTRGNLTPSALTIKDANGNPVASPANPGETNFNIFVKDLDKQKFSGKLKAYVINAKKGDTLEVYLEADASNPGMFHTTSLISAVSKPKESRTANEISFYPGDTIQVMYIDPDDEEDISKQSFFAESHSPVPEKVLAQDSDCDGVADQLAVIFSNALEEDYKFESIRAYIDGMADTVTLTVNPADAVGKSEVIIPLTDVVVPATPTPSGKATISITYQGATSSENIRITDGILPTLKSVTILENPNHESEQDTIMVAFSEPVIIADETSWPIITNGAAGTIYVIGKPVTNNDGLSWQYVITGNTDGKVIPVNGTAAVSSNAVITDKALNALIPAGGCNPSVTIAETPKPVPVTLAEMRDIEGDGYPDEIYVRFKKHIRPKDMLDSFVVDWGRPSIIKSFITTFDSSTGTIVPKEDYWTISDSISEPRTVQVTADSSIIVIDTVSILKITIPASLGYPLGTTSGSNGNESGYYGSIVPRLGPAGGFFDKDYPLVDACPPIILKAVKVNNENTGVLSLTYSEPLTLLESDLLYYIQRKRGTNNPIYVHPDNASQGEGKATFIFSEKNEESVNVGDFVRLDSNATTSRYKDKAGNYPTRYNPWVKVVGSSSEKTRFKVTMAQPVTQINETMPLYTIATQPAEGEIFRLTVVNYDGTESIVDANYNIGTPLGTDYAHGGPVFQIKISMPAAQMEGNATQYLYDMKISIKANLYDNLGQFIVDKSINIDFATNPAWRDAIAEDGSLNLNLEWVAHNGAAPVSASGKKLGTGAYISKFDFKATKICTEDFEEEDGISCKVGQNSSDADNTTKTFGFKRGKKR